MGKEKKTAGTKSKSKPNKSVNDAVGNGNQNVIADPRFARAKSDPRFQTVRKKQSKVKIDSRFDKMFTNKEFSSKASLDKRGKRTERKNENADLKRYYQKSEESESEDSSEEEEERDESGEGTASESESSTDDDMALVFDEDVPEIEVEDVPLVEESTRRLAVVNMDWRHVQAVDLYMSLRSCLPKGGDIVSVSVYPSEFGLQRMKEEEVRGPVGLFDDENEKNSEDSDDDGNDEIDHEKVREYEKSKLRYYYAVVECDSVSTADHIYKACDGTELERTSNVLDLRFIPESMEFKHPPRDVATEAPAKYEGLDFNTKALQHTNIDISWDEDDPRRTKTFRRHLNGDELAELDMKEYVADDSDSDDEDSDDSAEDKSEEKKSKLEEKKNKYLALIQPGDGSDDEDEDKFQDMEVTFHTGLENVSKRILEKRNKESESVWDEQQRKRREKKSRNKKSQDSPDDYSSDGYAGKEEAEDDFFVDEPSLEKVPKIDARRKGGKKGKSSADIHEEAEATTAELELLVDNDNGLKGYKLKPKKMKGKKGKVVMDDDKIPSVNLNDQRFSKLFTSPLFALDPTDPQYKRSAPFVRQMSQKHRKEDLKELHEEEPPYQPARGVLLSGHPDTEVHHQKDSDIVPLRGEKHELASLVKSIKRNSQQVKLSSKDQLSKKQKVTLLGISEKLECPDPSYAQTQRKTNTNTEKKNKKAKK